MTATEPSGVVRISHANVENVKHFNLESCSNNKDTCSVSSDCACSSSSFSSSSSTSPNTNDNVVNITDSSCQSLIKKPSVFNNPLPPKHSVLRNQIPSEILNDIALNEMISALPSNYNFEVHKTIYQIRKAQAKIVALQLPEGLQRFALLLADIMKRFGGEQMKEAIIMGNVTYGACCVDDRMAVTLGCDFLVHYGHSCLIPITKTLIPCLYIFVEIAINGEPLERLLRKHFGGKKIGLMATIQFVNVLHTVKAAFITEEQSGSTAIPFCFIPQIKPLSPGEVLGCTAPRLPSLTDAFVFVADGRFHLEAAMMANPKIPAYRYDPFVGALFKESYDHQLMLKTRQKMILIASQKNHFGLILGTLGRQGNPDLFATLESELLAAGKQVSLFDMEEVQREVLKKYPEIEVWVQTSCPRLSIDWNYTFGEETPLLTPYEANVMLRKITPFWQKGKQSAHHDISFNNKDMNGSNEESIIEGEYPMDYYASGDAAHQIGPWTPGYFLRPPRQKNVMSEQLK